MQDRLKILLLFTGGLILLRPIYALDLDLEQCFRPSPALERGEKIFTYPKVRKLDDTEYTAVQRLFENIIGTWQGTMDELNCHGSQQDVSKEVLLYRVKSQAVLDLDGNLTLTSTTYNAKKRVQGQHIYTLAIKEKILRWGNDYGLVEPISIDSGRLSFMHRSGASGLIREVYITIESHDNLLVIDEQIYTYGKFNGHRFWYLQRE